MTQSQQDRLKGLLGVMVRRHTRLDQASQPVGRLIAEEARRVQDDNAARSQANDDANRQLVDRLYRRFLLPRHSTVEAYAESCSVACDR